MSTHPHSPAGLSPAPPADRLSPQEVAAASRGSSTARGARESLAPAGGPDAASTPPLMGSGRGDPLPGGENARGSMIKQKAQQLNEDLGGSKDRIEVSH